MLAPNFVLAVLLIFCTYLIWQDFKTRDANTFLGIAMLLFLAIMSTLSLAETNIPFVRIALQSIVISITLAVITIHIAKMQMSALSVFCTVSVFSPILYTYALLLGTSNPIPPLALFVPGLFIWYILHNVRAQIKSTLPGGTIIWAAIYLFFILLSGGILGNYVESVYATRMVLVLNFFMPLSMQISSAGFGEGDVLMIWMIIAALIYLGFDITAGYSMLFYVSILICILYPARTGIIWYRKRKHDLLKIYVREISFAFFLLITLGILAFTFMRGTVTGILTFENDMFDRVAITLLSTIAIFIALKMLAIRNSRVNIVLKEYSPVIQFGLIAYTIFKLFSIHYFALYCVLFLAMQYKKQEQEQHCTPETFSGNTCKNIKSRTNVLIPATLLCGILMLDSIVYLALENPSISNVIVPFSTYLPYITVMATIFSVANPLVSILGYFMNARQGIWKTLEEELKKSKETATEPLALELTLALLLIILIGTPADILLKYLL